MMWSTRPPFRVLLRRDLFPCRSHNFPSLHRLFGLLVLNALSPFMNRLYCLIILFLSGCATVNSPNSYQYVIYEVPEGAHRLSPILNSEYQEGAFEMIPLNQQLKAKGDTLQVWVEHFAPGSSLNETRARYADVLLMCYPEHLPGWATPKHVFPWHEGRIYLYTLSENVVVVSTDRIDTFDLVLLAKAKKG